MRRAILVAVAAVGLLAACASAVAAPTFAAVTGAPRLAAEESFPLYQRALSQRVMGGAPSSLELGSNDLLGEAQAGLGKPIRGAGPQNRLTWAGSTGTPPCSVPVTPQSALNAFSQSFTYDALGRLTSGSPGTYTYGDSAHLHAVTAITAGTVTRYTAGYDAAENMTCRDSQGANCPGNSGAALFYNAPGSLVSWENNSAFPTAGSNCLYDNQGSRVEKMVTPQNGTPTTTVYVGNLEEVTTSGSTTAVTSFYYAGPLRIATAVSGVVSYLASDGLGSASVALNASGSPTASVLSGPYGQVRYSSGSMPTDYGFTGQHSDSASGLDYYVSRYYDPVAGQFTSTDSILPGHGYDVFGLSRYAYVEGNPQTRTDPSGQDPCRFEGTPCGGVHHQSVGRGYSSTRNWKPTRHNSTPAKRGPSFHNPCVETSGIFGCPLPRPILNPQCMTLAGGWVCGQIKSPYDPLASWLLGWESQLEDAAKGGATARAAERQAAEAGATRGISSLVGAGPGALSVDDPAFVQVLSESAARRAAFRTYDVPTSLANNFERVPQFGRNPNILGPNGEPWEILRTTDLNGNTVEVQNHMWGHVFEDTGEVMGPHYLGANGEHFFYEPQ